MLREFLRISAISFASGIQVLLLALLTLVLARVLSLDAFGITRTVTAYMVILLLFGHFCLHDAVSTYVASGQSTEEKTLYVANGSYLTIFFACGTALISIILIQFSGLWRGDLQQTLFAIALLLPFMALTTVYSSLLQALGSYRKLTVSLMLAGVIPLVLIAPPSSLWGLPGWIAGRAVSSFILLCLAFGLISEYFRFTSIDRTTCSRLLGFSRIQVFSGILSMTMQSADVIALERLKGDMSQVAIYGLASLFGKSVLFLPGAVGRVYFRDIAESVGHETKMWNSIRRLFIVTMGLCSLIAILIYFFVPVLIEHFYGDKYLKSIPVLKVLCLGIVFSGLWASLSVINIALKKPFNAVLISAVGVTVCLMLLYILVPVSGALGAAWAMNGAYLAGTLMGFLLLQRCVQR